MSKQSRRPNRANRDKRNSAKTPSRVQLALLEKWDAIAESKGIDISIAHGFIESARFSTMSLQARGWAVGFATEVPLSFLKEGGDDFVSIHELTVNDEKFVLVPNPDIDARESTWRIYLQWCVIRISDGKYLSARDLDEYREVA
ncbi:hypothetical protein ACVXZ4_04255 [Lacisediminihabitans sp. FW035]